MTTAQLIKHLQRKMVDDATLSGLGFTVKNVKQGYSPLEGAEVTFPVSTILYDDNSSPVWQSTFTNRQVTIEVHTKTYFDAEQAKDAIKDLFHKYSYANTEIDIHLMTHVGGMGSPAYNAKINAWSTMLQFNVRSG
jgi:conjugal transfer/entry exclusion protein